MSLVIEDRTCFSGFCPCLYYNAVLRHVKQDWLCQPCLACILLITFPIFLRRKFPAENGFVPNPDGVPSMFYNADWSGVNISEFIGILNDYLYWYNEKRIKKSLGYLSPIEYRHRLGLVTQIVQENVRTLGSCYLNTLYWTNR